MAVERVRSLSEDFRRDVLPSLEAPRPGNKPLDRNGVNSNNSHMTQGKEHALRTVWSHLLESVGIQNIQIKMRDGHEVELRIYTPTGALTHAGNGRPVVYSLHGGGFISGNNDTEELINRQLCSACDVLVCSLDYRLAPQFPVVTTQFADVEDGLRWVYANASKYGGDVSTGLFVSGTSSGAAEVAMLSYRSKSLEVPIKGMIMRQPAWIFGTYETLAKKEWLPFLKSREENFDAPILSGQMVITLNKIIAISPEDAVNPNNFPIYASPEQLARMPPTYIVEATCDPVVDEVELWHRLLIEAGVKTKLTKYEGMPHGFHAHHVLKAARDEMKDTADGLKWLMEVSSK